MQPFEAAAGEIIHLARLLMLLAGLALAISPSVDISKPKRRADQFLPAMAQARPERCQVPRNCPAGLSYLHTHHATRFILD
jgi:hypothetical protein